MDNSDKKKEAIDNTVRSMRETQIDEITLSSETRSQFLTLRAYVFSSHRNTFAHSQNPTTIAPKLAARTASQNRSRLNHYSLWQYKDYLPEETQ